MGDAGHESDMKLRWGLLSTARINRAIIPALRASSRAELVAVASRDLARATAYARERQIPMAYGSYEALLAAPDIDVIYNALPNSLHADWTIRACEAGKHVLCEKPIALTVEDVDRITSAARRHGRVVTEAFMYRHHPQTHRVRELVAERAIGDIRVVRGGFTFTLTDPHSVRLDAALGGGSLWDVGCYPVSWARAILGSEPSIAFGWARQAPCGVDESFAGQLQFPGDVTLQFDCGFTAPFRTTIEIIGADGMLRVSRPYKPPVEGDIELIRGDDVRRLTTSAQELYVGEVEDLNAAVLDGTRPVISLADSRANTAAIVALHASARSGRPESIAVPVE